MEVVESPVVTTLRCAVGAAVNPEVPITDVVVPSVNHNVPSSAAS